jgi:RNA polymerase sigma factor (sigma-70 family)
LRLRGDEELVARSRDGDERAFELLYERHLPGVLSFCRHMLADSAEAEDAVQHTFAAAYRELMEGDRPLRVKAWLYTVARNRCLSLLRDRRERPRDEIELSTAGLQEVVQQRAELRELLADLHDLPADQRAALVLAELEDLSHEEIAAVIECPVPSVKGLVFRARAGLMERHDAREAACSDIRAELAVARRGGLRRGRLKHHLKACPDCAAYLDGLKRQRQMLALVLPVVPTAGLKPGLLASVGLGGGAAAGGLAAVGTAGTAATVAIAAVIGGAGLAGHGPLSSDPPAGGRAGASDSSPATPRERGVSQESTTEAPTVSRSGVAPPAGAKRRADPSRRAAPAKRVSSRGSRRVKGPKPLKSELAPRRVKPPKPARPTGPRQGRPDKAKTSPQPSGQPAPPRPLALPQPKVKQDATLPRVKRGRPLKK